VKPSVFELALATQKLGDFVSLMVAGYEQAAHVRAICEHLEALERRDVRRLIVTMPPRHGKSLHASQALPAWYLGRRPSEHVILASYGAELAETNSRRARAFVADPRWPFETALAQDSAAVGRWHTTEGGGVIAAGFGADLLVIDDPLKGSEEADSETIREASWRWLSDVAMTRLHKDAVVLLCLTRWHEDDLAGRLLSGPTSDAWTVLSLPALAEENDPLGRTEGEPLWAERYGVDALSEQRETMGGRAWAAIFQQRPTPDIGGTFQRSWLEGRYDNLPEDAYIVQSVDSAFKTGVGNDYSVVATWATDRRFYYLVDVWRGRVEFPELVRAIKKAADEHKPRAILIEDAAAGQSAIQALLRDTKLPIVPAPAKGSKVSRAEAVSPLFEAGKVLLPRQSPRWLGHWVEEHVAFPGSRHDDQVDTTSLALDRLRASQREGGGVAGAIVTTRRDRRRHGCRDEPEDGSRRRARVQAQRDRARLRPLSLDDPRYL
jgi:predicted phage terminase large subunit-like protein